MFLMTYYNSEIEAQRFGLNPVHAGLRKKQQDEAFNYGCSQL